MNRRRANFSDSRRGPLDGVVFSGGGPTLQAALPQAVQDVGAPGFRIGLHSAGPYPERRACFSPTVFSGKFFRSCGGHRRGR